MSTGGKRAKSVAIPGATHEVFNIMGYFERQTHDWGDDFVLRVQEVATDTYMSVKEDESLSLKLYREINTLYKRKKDKVKPVNRPHKEGFKLEEVENCKEQIAVYKANNSNKSGSQYPWLIPKFSNIECGR